MAGKTTAYTFKNVIAMCDGQHVRGFWEGDDVLSVTPMVDAGTMVIGADGDGIFSQTANEGATIVIRLQHTSPTHRLLEQRLARQRAPGVRLVGFPFSAMNVDTGEGGATAECFISAPPADVKGAAAGVREWTLVTAAWRREIPRPT